MIKTSQNSLKKSDCDRNTSSLAGNYTVVLDIFEGPLDVLIHLIKKEKINIYEVSISKITDQYLAFLQTMQILDLNIAAEFLVMAATLIYMKSQILLNPKESHDEELEEQKKELIDRLIEYKKYKKVSERLNFLAEQQKNIFFRQGTILNKIGENRENIQVEIFDLVYTFQNVVHNMNEEETFIPIEISEIQIQDKIRSVLHYLSKNNIGLFNEILEGNYERKNIIVTFLALLELVKMGQIYIYQSTHFANITLSLNSFAAESNKKSMKQIA